MMRVIIDEQKPIALVLDLKATARMLEFAQRNRNFFKGNPKLGAEGDHANGILDIVPAGDIQDCFAQLLPAAGTMSRMPLADRKSTRLNSSHVSNSYAVFCLK